MKTVIQKDILFIAELFTIAKIQKQSKCALVEDWIREMGAYLQCSTCSATTRLPFVTTGMDLEGVTAK